MAGTTERAIRTLGVRMYGLSLNLSCDKAELADYVACLLPGLAGEPDTAPDLVVNCRWVTTPTPRGSSLFDDARRLDGLGKRMQIAEDELIWFDTHRDKDLQLRFRRDASGPQFDVAYCYQPSQKKAAKYPDFERKKYFDLLRYLVFFPLAWHLERTRGWSMMHASAVADGERAILVAGPGGAGKTTTCMALAARAGMRLITENLLFTDGLRVYPLPEPIRLTEESRSLLEDDLEQLAPVELPGGLRNKTMYWLSGGPSLDPVRATRLFLPRFSDRGFVEPLSPGLAAELLGASNRLTLELDDYYWYSAGLDLLWPQADNAQRKLDVLRRLTETAGCYTLGIDRAAGVEQVVEQVQNNLKETEP